MGTLQQWGIAKGAHLTGNQRNMLEPWGAATPSWQGRDWWQYQRWRGLRATATVPQLVAAKTGTEAWTTIWHHVWKLNTHYPKVQWFDITGTHLHQETCPRTCTAALLWQPWSENSPNTCSAWDTHGGASRRGWSAVKAHEHQWGWLRKHSVKRRRETQEPLDNDSTHFGSRRDDSGVLGVGSSYLWKGEWSGDYPRTAGR